jgi:hypothetical protein
LTQFKRDFNTTIGLTGATITLKDAKNVVSAKKPVTGAKRTTNDGWLFFNENTDNAPNHSV